MGGYVSRLAPEYCSNSHKVMVGALQGRNRAPGGPLSEHPPSARCVAFDPSLTLLEHRLTSCDKSASANSAAMLSSRAPKMGLTFSVMLNTADPTLPTLTFPYEATLSHLVNDEHFPTASTFNIQRSMFNNHHTTLLHPCHNISPPSVNATSTTVASRP